MSSLKVLYAYSKGLRKYFVVAILFVIIETSFDERYYRYWNCPEGYIRFY